MSKRSPFHFVFAHPGSEKDRKRESQLARSHTARVNREKRAPVRQQSKSSTSTQPRKLAQRSENSPSDSSESSADSETSRKTGRPPADTDDETSSSGRSNSAVVSHAGSTKSLSPTTSQAVTAPSSVALTTPRTVSPVLGAQSSATFNLGSSTSEISRAADYSASTTVFSSLF
jgi:hypothetical protein